MPGVAWLIAFFVLSVYAVMAVAFGTVDPILRTSVPERNPLAWDFTAMSGTLDRVFGGDLGTVFLRTLTFVVTSLSGCILIGYPVAYYVARKAGRWRSTLTPGVSAGTRIIDCWLWREAWSGLVLPMKMKTAQRGSPAFDVHHLRPLMT